MMRKGHRQARHTGERADFGMAAMAAVAAAGVLALAINPPHKPPSGPDSNAGVAAASGHSWTPTRMAAATPLDSPTDPAQAATSPSGPATPSDPPTTADGADAPTVAAAASSAATSDPVPVPSPSATGGDNDASDASSPSEASATPAKPQAAPAPPTPTSRKTAPGSQPFAGVPSTGILFFTDKSMADHFCTASVVHSPAGDLAATAGHCAYAAGGSAKADMVFVPGYRDGQAPYGQWPVAQVLVAPGWSSSGDTNVDVAFLVLAKSAAGAGVESVTGANQIAFNRGFGQLVTIPAYPGGSATPITCSNATTEFNASQTEFDCGGYPDGTSGAPFLINVDGSGNQGTIIGVIGGYQEGGDTPAVSYSSYFGNDVAALYQSAVAAG